MDKVGKDSVSGGGGYPEIGPVLQGSGTCGATLWVRVMGNVRRDDEGGVGKPQGVHPSDHGEAGEA